MKIGTDESGKGDYFGYLVVAGVVADSSISSLGVKDSKKLSDSSLHKIAAGVRKAYPYEIVKISPEKYNILYAKMKNLNDMLAWAHARVIENLLKSNDVSEVVVDKFASEKVLDKYLMERGQSAKIELRVRGEEDPVVAAASVLARSEYLGTLRMLGRELGMVLPRGSSDVVAAARQLAKDYGKDILPKVAKMNFKITKKL